MSRTVWLKDWSIQHGESPSAKKTCGLSYDRDGLAAYAILLRSLSLCGQTSAVNAVASALLGSVEADQSVIRPDDDGCHWSEEEVHVPNRKRTLYTRVNVPRNSLQKREGGSATHADPHFKVLFDLCFEHQCQDQSQYGHTAGDQKRQ